MPTIIQLSDFHVRSSFPDPANNIVFVNMIKAIMGQLKKEDHPILVYNGDFISRAEMSEAVEDCSNPTLKDQIWRDTMRAAFDKAYDYFNYMTTQIGISSKDIIICCGNHDVYSGDAIDFDMECPMKKSSDEKLKEQFARIAKYGRTRFALFNDCAKRITGTDDWHKTRFIQIQEINFLIVNTNWIDKYGEGGAIRKLCIDCQSINNEIKEHAAELCENTNKAKNIFVAHAPIGDYCEYARYNGYAENPAIGPIPEVDSLFGLKLYGDKHSLDENTSGFIVGAPLDAPRISLIIHTIDETAHRYMVVHYIKSADKWAIRTQSQELDRILDLSKQFIKDQAMKYLFGDANKSLLPNRILKFAETRSMEKWTCLSELLCASTEVRNHFDGTEKYEVINPADRGGFITMLTNIINNAGSPERNIITIKGAPRLGKSVCLSLLYMNMLYEYSTCGFRYIPLYFDIENAVSKIETDTPNLESDPTLVNRDCTQTAERFKMYFRQFLQEGLKLAKELSAKVVLIIDGLSQHYLYDENRIEDTIDDLIGELDPNESIIARLITCIDFNDFKAFGNVRQQETRKSEYVIFFKKLLSIVVGENKKYDVFMHAFSELQSSSELEEEKVKESIRKLNIQSVDTNFLISSWDQLKKGSSKSYYSLLSSFTDKKLTAGRIGITSAACYDYAVRSKPYSDLIVAGLTNNEFDFIRTQEMVINYLLAVNYVNCIDRYDKNNHECLNRLYGHSICSFIRARIEHKEMQIKLLSFAEEHGEELSLQGISTLSYLVGRTELLEDQEFENRKKKWLKRIEKFINKRSCDDDETRFFQAVARRTIRISCIKNSNDSSSMFTYIRTLIGNDFERRVNRSFYLQFYGDRMDAYGKSARKGVKVDLLFNGFDIFYTYHILTSRLIRLKGESDWNVLLELELFTLCDLIQRRFDTTIAFDPKKKESVKSFFYNPKYNQPDNDMAEKVLSNVVKIINNYLNLFESKSSKDVLFVNYLKDCKNRFARAKDIIMKGPLDEKDFCYRPEQVLSSVMRIRKIKRVGWSIKENPTDTIPREKVCEYQDPKDALETTLEHTFEAYMIGLLYLPEAENRRKGYDKQEVLNMLLLHDLGEAEVGDIIPAFETAEELRSAEDSYCKWLFLQSAHNGISNLNKYFDLWIKWSGKQGDFKPKEIYNVKVAKDIDVIQRLYRMLCFLLKEIIEFSNERVKEFYRGRGDIKTEEGKRVFNVLIGDNPTFVPVFKKYSNEMSAKNFDLDINK